MTKRKKQIVSLFLCAALALGLLAGCGTGEAESPSPTPETTPTESAASPTPTPSEEPEPSADPAEKLSAQGIVESIYFSLVENVGGMDQMYTLGSALEYLSSRFGVADKDCASVGIIVASYRELVVLRCVDEDAADRVEEQLRSCAASAQESMQAEDLDTRDPAAVYRQGLYVGLFTCPDPDQAGNAFLSVLATGELLNRTAAVTERPAFEPHDLLLRLLVEGGACPDWGKIKSKGWSDAKNSNFYGLSFIASTYGAAPSQYEACTYAFWDPESSKDVDAKECPYQLALFQTAGEAEAKALAPALTHHLETRRAEIQANIDYMNAGKFAHNSYYDVNPQKLEKDMNIQPRLLENLQTACVTQAGRYVAVLIFDNPAEVAILFPRYAASTDTKGFFERYVNSGTQGVEYEHDPDYPDRELFTPPNEEDMTIYDTSAILSAWEKGDPSALSDYDREIYDAAQAVLDEVTTDSMTELEKETAVYTWITQTVNYGWSHMDILAETSRDSYGPYGGLVNHEAVCLGYATTFQLLMDLLDIECVTVVGAGFHSTGDHAWNVVKLNGNWYCTDVTWDTNGREQMGEEYEWRYFNITSDEMAENHQWDYANVPEAVTEGKGRP